MRKLSNDIFQAHFDNFNDEIMFCIGNNISFMESQIAESLARLLRNENPNRREIRANNGVSFRRSTSGMVWMTRGGKRVAAIKDIDCMKAAAPIKEALRQLRHHQREAMKLGKLNLAAG